MRDKKKTHLPKPLIAGALALGGYAIAAAFARQWHERWGATDDEVAMPLPGDDLMEYASANHAITIDAPPDAVWPWLVQIGQDRGGFYSYTWLENSILAHIHNAEEVHP